MSDVPDWIWASPESDDGWRWPDASKFPMQGRPNQIAFIREDLHKAALDAAEAETARAVEATLDAAHEYLVAVYGHSPLAHPVDRARINAIRTGAKT